MVFIIVKIEYRHFLLKFSEPLFERDRSFLRTVEVDEKEALRRNVNMYLEETVLRLIEAFYAIELGRFDELAFRVVSPAVISANT